MPTYSYEGINKSGQRVSGIKQCHSEKALIASLINQGIFVEKIKEVKTKKSLKKWLISRNVKRYLPDIFFQLALLLKSGISLSSAIQTLADSTINPRLKTILLDILSDISQGNKFSTALSNIPNFCPEIYINMIIVAEASGRLDDILMNIANYEEKKNKDYGKIKSALVYPITVLMLGMGVLGFLLAYVVPKIQKIFWTAKRHIPLSTKILIITGNFLKHYGLLLAMLLLFLVFLLKFIYTKNLRFRLWIDKKLYNIEFVKQSILARFSDLVAFQLNQAISVTQALELGSKTCWNLALQKKVAEIIELIKSGHSLSSAIKKVGFFPEIFIAAVTTGEKSGNLSEILARISAFYMRNTENTSMKFISILEPIFIVFIGAIVGFIVLSIMGPLFQINTFISMK